MSSGGTTALHVCFVQELEAYVLPSGKRHVMFRSMSLRNILERKRTYPLVKTMTQKEGDVVGDLQRPLGASQILHSFLKLNILGY